MKDFTYDPLKDKLHPVLVQEKCAHCDDPVSLEAYPVALVVRAQQRMLLYCTLKCQIAHSLDQLKFQIETTGEMDLSWAHFVQQLHDQLKSKERPE